MDGKVIDKDNKDLFYRPSYYMRPTRESRDNKIEKIISSMKSREEIARSEEYKLNIDKIKTLEDAKEVLSALNLKMNIQNGYMSFNINCNAENLIKYMDLYKDIQKDILQEDVLELNEIKIRLHDNSVDKLVKYEFGKRLYYEQIKYKLNKTQKNVIIIPDNIKNVSISFVQGLLDDIAINWGREYFINNFQIRGPKLVVSKIYFAIDNFLF